MSHTLGPWKVSDPFQNEYGVSVYAGEIPIATGIQAPSRFDIPRKQELEEIRANAHLIAAAPDLLAALKHARIIFSTPSNGVWRVPSEPVLSETMNRVCAAIAHAEGRP